MFNMSVIILQMNSVLTKIDTSLWLTKWIPRSLNWLDINPLKFVTFLKEFTYEVNNFTKFYQIILPTSTLLIN